MPFTDDDLKRLKEEISYTDDGSCHQVCFGCGIDMRALLARLEAAENHIEDSVKVHGTYCSDKISYLKWLKSAGREGR